MRTVGKRKAHSLGHTKHAKQVTRLMSVYPYGITLVHSADTLYESHHHTASFTPWILGDDHSLYPLGEENTSKYVDTVRPQSIPGPLHRSGYVDAQSLAVHDSGNDSSSEPRSPRYLYPHKRCPGLHSLLKFTLKIR